MQFKRLLIEEESPEQFGYERIKYNLTESSTSDKSIADVGIIIDPNILLCYGDHFGKVELRKLIGEKYGLKADNILITTGACMALFVTYLTILKPGDEVIIIYPNYPANIEIPTSLGCHVNLYNLEFDKQYRLDVMGLIDMLRPGVKAVSITYPHNPTGTMITPDEILTLVTACESNGTYLIVDETYGDLTEGKRLPNICNSSEYGICIESLSKAIGVPGLRIGWVATSNEKLLQSIIAVKEQICICGSVIDEDCAYQVLLRNEELMHPIRQDLKEKFAVLCEIMGSQDLLEWVKPESGVVCFPRIRSDIELKTEEFYDVLNNKYGTFVGPGRWFSMSDRNFRVGYAWPDKAELRTGMLNILSAINDVRIK
jgi:aspartate/methionine/tyrosine aminotransferase